MPAHLVKPLHEFPPESIELLLKDPFLEKRAGNEQTHKSRL